MRMMSLSGSGLWGSGYFDFRYRYNRLRYEGESENRDFDLGGLFVGSGFVF